MFPESDTQPAIHIDQLHVARGGKSVLNGLNLTVQKGEVYALLGGNGAGKSTTIACLLGLLRPSQGTIRVAGRSVLDTPDAARAEMAYLPENVALYEPLTAYENLDYFLSLAGQAADRAAMDAALDSVGLAADARDKRTGGYSKGMRQKVAIALAVLRAAPILLLDEPTSGLDPRATAEFNALIGTLKAQGSSILMVTHDLLGAADCADRIGFLAGGRIMEEIATGADIDVLALHHRYLQASAA